jgi:hypothetical protein
MVLIKWDCFSSLLRTGLLVLLFVRLKYYAMSLTSPGLNLVLEVIASFVRFSRSSYPGSMTG